MAKRKADSAPEAAPAIWQNRITRYGEAAPDQLLANDKKWRIHPRAQEHALDGAIERARAQLELAVRAGGDILNDRVAVAVFLGQGEQDMERGRRQHVLNYSHSGYILQGYRRGAG